MNQLNQTSNAFYVVFCSVHPCELVRTTRTQHQLFCPKYDFRAWPIDVGGLYRSRDHGNRSVYRPRVSMSVWIFSFVFSICSGSGVTSWCVWSSCVLSLGNHRFGDCLQQQIELKAQLVLICPVSFHLWSRCLALWRLYFATVGIWQGRDPRVIHFEFVRL